MNHLKGLNAQIEKKQVENPRLVAQQKKMCRNVAQLSVYCTLRYYECSRGELAGFFQVKFRRIK